MGFARQFEKFDPLTGKAPAYPFSLLPSIAARARKLLKDRTRDEIEGVAHSADWLIDEYFDNAKTSYVKRVLNNGGWPLDYLPEEDRTEAGIIRLLENWPVEAKEPPPFIPAPDNTSELDALKASIGGYALDDDADFHDGHEFEYFAVLSLWMLGEAIEWLSYSKEGGRDSIDDPTISAIVTTLSTIFDKDDCVFHSTAGEYALKAMDAVCWGEHLQAIEVQMEELKQLRIELHRQTEKSDELAEAKVKERMSLNAQKAAIKRHKENRAIKEQVFEWYAIHKDEFPSMDAAAEAVAGILVPVTFRTAREWIGKYVKNLRSARRP